ncbi:hypothetical protein CR983_00995 [Candidatus Saccharibacteria bacterium]|nr:MAG: hypothetical protein CR983_00995 [Candidatus Saccharibacteria bacterium]
MKQARKGTYTKQISRTHYIKRTVKRYVNWFRRLSRTKKILVIMTPIVLAALIIPIATYLYFARDIADQERLMNRNNTGIVLEDINGKAFYSVGRAEDRALIGLDQIADDMEDALIATEDKNFYKHGGFSILSTLRAIYGYILQGGSSFGGSTITQQLAKITVLSSERTALRQYQAFTIAAAIENTYTKDQILEMYLNTVYYGENAFGIEDAAKVYFDKKPSELTLAESALLVGLLPAPSAYSPISGDKELARERQEEVLDRMVRNEYISEAEKQAALREKLVYAKPDSSNSSAPHFTEMVINRLSEEYDYETVMRSGYQVRTTLDIDLQNELEKNISNHLPIITANGGSNASAVAIDPQTGEVRALVGSADYDNKEWGKVNMVTTARQPGSTFKTLYYAAALGDGVITPATILKDRPINIGGWQPQNADRRYRGDISVRNAISRSLNIPSVEVMQKYGVERSVKAAKKLGVTSLDESRDYGLPLAIGSGEVPLLEMTSAYATLANSGEYNQTTLIKSITDKFGEEIYRSSGLPERAISEAGAFLISDILSDNDARAPVFGASLTVPGKTVAVKTGTTDESRDALTIGYTPSLVLGVWVGNNDNKEMFAGGYTQAGPIWRNTMSWALRDKPAEKFVAPSTVVRRATCYSNYGIATNDVTYDTFQEYYLSSALPTTTCTPVEPKLTVCDIEAGEIIEIKASAYDESRHSKEADDCKKPEDDIEVCEIDSGRIVTISESDFDEQFFSRDTENCGEPPDDESSEEDEESQD